MSDNDEIIWTDPDISTVKKFETEEEMDEFDKPCEPDEKLVAYYKEAYRRLIGVPDGGKTRYFTSETITLDTATGDEVEND